MRGDAPVDWRRNFDWLSSSLAARKAADLRRNQKESEGTRRTQKESEGGEEGGRLVKHRVRGRLEPRAHGREVARGLADGLLELLDLLGDLGHVLLREQREAESVKESDGVRWSQITLEDS